jgi:hypothetical protein
MDIGLADGRRNQRRLGAASGGSSTTPRGERTAIHDHQRLRGHPGIWLFESGGTELQAVHSTAAPSRTVQLNVFSLAIEKPLTMPTGPPATGHNSVRSDANSWDRSTSGVNPATSL